MKRFLFITGTFLSACFTRCVNGADLIVFKCVDKIGRVEFTDVAKDGCKPVDLPGFLSTPALKSNLQRASSDPPSDSRITNIINIPRSRNGHFEVSGTVNGVPVMFLVDTGASAVAISDQVAIESNLPVGRSMEAKTANGMVRVRVVEDIEVSIGAMAPIRTVVSTGLIGNEPQLALLGESFLKYFDIQISGNIMTIKRHPYNSTTKLK
jgi:clan AA aspartic protease (TIGR02281 family)